MHANVMMSEDFDIFLDTGDLAVTATLAINTAPGQTPRTVTCVGILRTPTERQTLGPVTLDTDAPTFLTRTTDTLSNIRRGDSLTIEDETFTIAAAPEMNSNTGMSRLMLVRGSLQDDTGDTFKTEYPPDTDKAPYTRPTHGILGKA